MHMTDRLAGKRAVVTGAGRGIGRAIALEFARQGARVAALGRTPASLENLAAEHAAILPLPVDVADEDSVVAAYRAIGDAFGGLDVLVTSAAVQLHDRDRRAHELPLEVWQETLAINLTGVFLTCKHGLRLMLASGGGSVINIGSPTGIRGSAHGYTAYSTSKGGVHALTRILATDYASDGIRVNTLVPGATEGPLIDGLLADPSVRAAIVAGVPLGRIGRSEEYTGLAVHLASDESTYSTGSIFLADGGHCIR
jgi:NAD(P)-dependent dehydrogenase (short-subunit alcohol dehydrogenase family)